MSPSSASEIASEAVRTGLAPSSAGRRVVAPPIPRSPAAHRPSAGARTPLGSHETSPRSSQPSVGRHAPARSASASSTHRSRSARPRADGTSTLSGTQAVGPGSPCELHFFTLAKYAAVFLEIPLHPKLTDFLNVDRATLRAPRSSAYPGRHRRGRFGPASPMHTATLRHIDVTGHRAYRLAALSNQADRFSTELLRELPTFLSLCHLNTHIPLRSLGVH